MDEEELKEQEEKEQEERAAYAEFLGQEPEPKPETDPPKADDPDDPKKTATDEKPAGLAFYEIRYDPEADTYTMSSETFKSIKGV